MTAKLSPTMIETLHHFAYAEMDSNVYGSNPYASGSINTLAALVDRGMLTPGYQHELTELGRRRVAELSDEYANHLCVVEARTAKCANRWHGTADAFCHMLCPECPNEQDAPTREQEDIESLVGWMRDARTAVEQRVSSRRMTIIVKSIIELANRMPLDDVITAQDREYIEWTERESHRAEQLDDWGYANDIANGQ